MEQSTPTRAVGRPRAFDTKRALDQAVLLFWRKGFLGTSITDLTEAMGISRPSLYSAFGNKESLLFQALERYFEGPSSYLQEALKEPTTYKVASHVLRGIVDLVCDSRTPPTCLWVHAALSCGDLSDPFAREFARQRAHGLAALRDRFQRGVEEGDLPEGTNAAVLAEFLQTVNVGLSVQAATGANRGQLIAIVEHTLSGWPIRRAGKR